MKLRESRREFDTLTPRMNGLKFKDRDVSKNVLLPSLRKMIAERDK